MKEFFAKIESFCKSLLEGDYKESMVSQSMPQTPVVPLVPTPSQIATPNIDTLHPWSSPKENYHNTRVLCDLAGLTIEEKNLICACIYQESEFKNTAVCHNKDALGVITSSDWGICQINDHYQVGFAKPFSSIADIVDNPTKTVSFMISMFKNGELKLWVSYSSGAYKRWLEPSSAMWGLTS